MTEYAKLVFWCSCRHSNLPNLDLKFTGDRHVLVIHRTKIAVGWKRNYGASQFESDRVPGNASNESEKKWLPAKLWRLQLRMIGTGYQLKAQKGSANRCLKEMPAELLINNQKNSLDLILFSCSRSDIAFDNEPRFLITYSTFTTEPPSNLPNFAFHPILFSTCT